ncbi:MAG: lytic transglycosylase domain-containing protein, partial [Candidatus Binatia bacterium]
LRSTAGLVAASRQLKGDSGDAFRKLVPATAWQESCWRQFVARAGEVTYIRSSRGSVGIMQVNERVWRGFYDAHRLRWDVSYNARAGAEILEQYFASAQDRMPVAEKDSKRLALATYAAYNGGPQQLRRYLDTKRKPSRALARVVDKLFGEKFDAPDGELEAKVSGCLTGGGIG